MWHEGGQWNSISSIAGTFFFLFSFYLDIWHRVRSLSCHLLTMPRKETLNQRWKDPGSWVHFLSCSYSPCRVPRDKHTLNCVSYPRRIFADRGNPDRYTIWYPSRFGSQDKKLSFDGLLYFGAQLWWNSVLPIYRHSSKILLFEKGSVALYQNLSIKVILCNIPNEV